MSIALTSHPNKVEFIWLSTTNSFPNASEYLHLLKSYLPHSFEIVNQANVYETVDELIQRLERRVREPDQITNVFLIIPGIHRINEFRNIYIQEREGPSIGENLERLLHEGPHVGIHSLIWSDRYETLRNIVSLVGLDYFNHRILFHVSIDDSNNVIGISDASRLGTEKRFLYRNQGWSDRVADKIKPYDLPSVSEFEELVKLIDIGWK